MGAAVLIGVWQYMGRENGRQMDKNSIRIGVLLYRGDDTFIGTLRSGLEDRAKEYEQETGIKVKLDIMDAKGSQNTQNSQVERLRCPVHQQRGPFVGIHHHRQGHGCRNSGGVL